LAYHAAGGKSARQSATPYRTFDNPIDLAADSGQLAIRHA